MSTFAVNGIRPAEITAICAVVSAESGFDVADLASHRRERLNRRVWQ